MKMEDRSRRAAVAIRTARFGPVAECDTSACAERGRGGALRPCRSCETRANRDDGEELFQHTIWMLLEYVPAEKVAYVEVRREDPNCDSSRRVDVDAGRRSAGTEPSRRHPRTGRGCIGRCHCCRCHYRRQRGDQRDALDHRAASPARSRSSSSHPVPGASKSARPDTKRMSSVSCSRSIRNSAPTRSCRSAR